MRISITLSLVHCPESPTIFPTLDQLTSYDISSFSNLPPAGK